MNHILEQQKERARDLRCVNGAMYFGAVEDDSCDCSTRCQNQQTYEHALEELDQFITQTHQATIAEVIMIAESMKRSGKFGYNKPLDVLIETLVRKMCKNKK